MSANRSVPHVIHGEELGSRDGREFDNVDPWSRQVSGRVALGSPADVEDAVTAARKAFDTSGWPQLSPRERGAVLHRLADLMEAHAEDLARADVTDMGRPIAGVRALDVPRAIENFRFFADSARQATSETYPMGGKHHAYLEYEPAGVVAAITPWNHPLMLGTWKIAAPLAWGNTVVHKPAEDTPTSAHLVGMLALESGMPPGVLNVVQGDGVAGGALAASPGIDRVTFTGSTAVGRSIAAAVAPHLTPVSLELGGKGATVVFPDADLDAAVDLTARAVFNNSGQVCLSTSRVHVQRSVFTDFVDRLVQKAASLTIGDPMEEATDLGPLASERHAAKVSEYFGLIASEGGEVLTGGPAEGWLFRPVVATGLAPTSRVCQEEIFGPIAVVTPFDDEAEAVRLANQTTYGLSAVVCTRDLARAHRMSRALRAGTVWVNCYQVRDLRAPLGGPGDSGIGREGGLFSREFFTEPKAVVMAVE